MQRTADSTSSGLSEKGFRNTQEILLASSKVANYYRDSTKSARFLECRSNHRFLAATQKQLILVSYSEPKGRPQEFARLTCSDVGINQGGLFSSWYVTYHPRAKTSIRIPHQTLAANRMCIQHTPLEVAQGVFMWHMAESVVIYDSALRVSMLCRSTHNPLKFRIPGQAYLMEEGQFFQMQGE